MHIINIVIALLNDGKNCPPPPIHILLADDDPDDRFFFKDALNELNVRTQLTTVSDGEQLIHYLKKHPRLPDVLFLDLNMPRKNGLECLSEIKHDKHLLQLPVIIYSTSLHDAVADELYANGAYFYIRKTDLTELRKMLERVLTMITEGKFARPSRKKFVLSLMEA